MLGDNIKIPTLDNINVSGVTDKIDWSAGSSDFYLLLFFAALIVLHIFLFKRDKIFALLFSAYSSYLLVFFFPFDLWLKSLSAQQMSLVKPAGFAVAILIIFIILTKSHLFASGFGGLIGNIIRGAVFGVLSAGLILTLAATLLDLSQLDKFSGLSLNLFTGELAQFIWIAVPLVAILFLIRRRRGPGRPSLG